MSAIAPIPTVMLAGVAFEIPQLTPRQQRVVVPAIMRLTDIMTKREEFMKQMTTDQFDMLIDLVFVACTKAKPTLKKDDFLNMEITVRELLEAIPLIMKQTGIMKETPAGEEQSASVNPNSLTGTN